METLDNYMTSDALVDMLVAKVAMGGNLLLDIGPTADGRIPVIMQQRLLDIGAWLKVNGEAIYGTKGWKNRPAAEKPQTTYYTVKGNDLYVLCTEWPVKPVLVPGLKKSGKVTLLGSGATVKTSFSGGKLTITPPSVNPATNPCEYAWVFKIADIF
jgi:alpha-L-fucosidase